MPDTEGTCGAKATVAIGRFTDADVECGRKPGHEEELHVASETKKAIDKRTGKESDATLIITWA
jgi:hypothetical protein